VPVNEMMQTPPPENDGPAWASFDVLALISEHIDSEDVAAIRCCCRSLRLALDAVVSSVSPAALVLLPRLVCLLLPCAAACCPCPSELMYSAPALVYVDVCDKQHSILMLWR
jgi:hypothetical protein